MYRSYGLFFQQLQDNYLFYGDNWPDARGNVHSCNCEFK